MHPIVTMAQSVKVKSAFYLGQSTLVGGTKTGVVAVAGSNVQAQLWIGVTDHLPRTFRQIYPNAPGHTHYQTDYSDWHLDTRVEAGDFGSDKAATAIALRLPHMVSWGGSVVRLADGVGRDHRRGAC